jgi:FAD/FMN-containing dehydrogenase
MTGSLAVPQLRGSAVTPDDRRYPALRSTYTASGNPAVVLLPADAEDVATALRFAREQGLPVSVRSGGHGLSARASKDGGVVVDLTALDEVRVLDRGARLVRIGPGARWASVASALAPSGLVVSSGDHGNVGVGGLATGAGVGYLARHAGLTIDRIQAAEVVLPDGRWVRADAGHHPDLFWAVRGAGAGVGAVVAFEVEAAAVPDVGVAQIVLGLDAGGADLHRLAAAVAASPRELTTNVVLQDYDDAIAASDTAVVASDDAEVVRDVLGPLLGTGARVLSAGAQIAPYRALVPLAHLHPNVGQQRSVSTNGLLTELGPEEARAIAASVRSRHRPLFQLRSVGGAVDDVAPDATAYAHRHRSWLVVASVFPPATGADLDLAWAGIGPLTDGSYANFESRPTAAVFHRAYPGRTGDRVLDLWRRYDPDALLRPFPV